MNWSWSTKHRPMASATTTTAIPVLIGSAVVIGGVGLFASRKLRRKTSSLAETDLSAAEWEAQVEFEDADAGTSA